MSVKELLEALESGDRTAEMLDKKDVPKLETKGSPAAQLLGGSLIGSLDPSSIQLAASLDPYNAIANKMDRSREEQWSHSLKAAQMDKTQSNFWRY